MDVLIRLFIFKRSGVVFSIILSTVGQLTLTDLEVKACFYSKVSKTYLYGRTYAFAVGFHLSRIQRSRGFGKATSTKVFYRNKQVVQKRR